MKMSAPYVSIHTFLLLESLRQNTLNLIAITGIGVRVNLQHVVHLVDFLITILTCIQRAFYLVLSMHIYTLIMMIIIIIIIIVYGSCTEFEWRPTIP